MTLSNPDPLPSAFAPPKRPSRFAGQLEAFRDLAFTGASAGVLKGAWRAHFSGRIGPGFGGRLVFEIGCFDAEFLCRIAREHPNVGFIGLDWKAGALCQGAERAAAGGLRNVALIHDRAQDAHNLFSGRELDDIWIFHPDPCDKVRELPNRLITGPFLLRLHALLRNSEASIAIKTDHPGYYQGLLALLGLPQPAWFAALDPATAKTAPKTRRRDLVSPCQLPPVDARLSTHFRTAVNSADFWKDPAAQAAVAGRLFSPHTTLFEARFLRKRLPIYLIELVAR